MSPFVRFLVGAIVGSLSAMIALAAVAIVFSGAPLVIRILFPIPLAAVASLGVVFVVDIARRGE